MHPPFSAALLAGGRSTRMGSDKALLAVDGELLWRRQRAVLAAAGAAEIFLSARAEQPWVAGAAADFAAVIADPVADQGPLGGLVAALAHARHLHVALLAIDLPRIQPAWFAQLRELCAPGVGAVGQHADGYEPLAALYPAELRPAAETALAGGARSLQRLVAQAVSDGRMRPRPIRASERGQFVNWNRPADR